MDTTGYNTIKLLLQGDPEPVQLPVHLLPYFKTLENMIKDIGGPISEIPDIPLYTVVERELIEWIIRFYSSYEQSHGKKASNTMNQPDVRIITTGQRAVKRMAPMLIMDTTHLLSYSLSKLLQLAVFLNYMDSTPLLSIVAGYIAKKLDGRRSFDTQKRKLATVSATTYSELYFNRRNQLDEAGLPEELIVLICDKFAPPSFNLFKGVMKNYDLVSQVLMLSDAGPCFIDALGRGYEMVNTPDNMPCIDVVLLGDKLVYLTPTGVYMENEKVRSFLPDDTPLCMASENYNLLVLTENTLYLYMPVDIERPDKGSVIWHRIRQLDDIKLRSITRAPGNSFFLWAPGGNELYILGDKNSIFKTQTESRGLSFKNTKALVLSKVIINGLPSIQEIYTDGMTNSFFVLTKDRDRLYEVSEDINGEYIAKELLFEGDNRPLIRSAFKRKTPYGPLVSYLVTIDGDVYYNGEEAPGLFNQIGPSNGVFKILSTGLPPEEKVYSLFIDGRTGFVVTHSGSVYMRHTKDPDWHIIETITCKKILSYALQGQSARKVRQRLSCQLGWGGMSFNGPVLVSTTREIRKRNPLLCRPGDQGSHLVGLNLMKILLNFYSVERDVVVTEDVIDELIQDINDKSNFACQTPEENENDKIVEQELLDVLFGDSAYIKMGNPAKIMFARLRQLLQTMVDNRSSSKELKLIQREIEEGVFPLRKTQ